MKRTLLLVAGGAVGYVFGARAGRERYDQMKARATSIWHDPTVQQKVTQAQDAAKERASEVQDTVSDAASQAAEKARSTMRRDHDGEVSDDDRRGQVREPR